MSSWSSLEAPVGSSEAMDEEAAEQRPEAEPAERKGRPERRQFSLGQDSLKRLAAVQERTGATSQSEVIRNALRVYDYLSEQEAQGRTILIEQDDRSVQLKLL